MTTLRWAFAPLREANRAALVPYLTVGDPDSAATVEYACALAEGGADLLELGIPFSDPLADGPVIQRATERALAAGTRTEDVLRVTEEVAAKTKLPIILMTYLNPVVQRGWETFAREAGAAGARGVILTDAPPEEAEPFLADAADNDLGLVFLVAPTSGAERVQRAAELSTGFVYCVARLGVTGVRSDLSSEFEPVLERVRAVSEVPIGVGFGISTPEHAAAAGKVADAVIVGSRLVAVADEAGRAAAPEALRDTAAGLSAALRGARA